MLISPSGVFYDWFTDAYFHTILSLHYTIGLFTCVLLILGMQCERLYYSLFFMIPMQIFAIDVWGVCVYWITELH